MVMRSYHAEFQALRQSKSEGFTQYQAYIAGCERNAAELAAALKALEFAKTHMAPSGCAVTRRVHAAIDDAITTIRGAR